MNVGVKSTRRQNFALACADLGAGSNDNGDTRLDIGISGLADPEDASVAQADVGLDDTPVVDNQSVGMTVSTAPFARVTCDWPMPSRMTLPPPNFTSSP